MVYRIRLMPAAEADLQQIYIYIRDHTSPATAQGYVRRIMAFLAGFETFPERGTLRTEIRNGLRMVGFERRVSVAFVVETEEVVVLRLLYAGRSFEGEAGEPLTE